MKANVTRSKEMIMELAKMSDSIVAWRMMLFLRGRVRFEEIIAGKHATSFVKG